MTAALRGRRKADKHRARRELLLAYRSGAFAGAAFGGKLKPFDHYTQEADAKPDQRSIAGAHFFFRALQARGVPIKIERVERN